MRTVKRRNYRNTERSALVSLRLPERPFLSLVGIQPIILDGGRIEKSSIFFSGRRPYRDDWATNTKVYPFTQYYDLRRRIGAENDEILSNTVLDEDLEGEILTIIYRESPHYDIPLVVDFSKKEVKKELVEPFQFQYFNIKLRTFGAATGRGIYTSSEEFYEKCPRIKMRGVFNLVDERILDRNTVIVGAAKLCAYSNPIVACPLIERESLLEFCSRYKMDVSTISVPKSGKRYPLIEKMLDWYEIYQYYMEHVGVERWYIETFDRIPDYYSVLHFKELP